MCIQPFHDRLACQCEHISHFEKDKRTPNGNPAHIYGASYARSYVVYARTDMGRFQCCKDCYEDCFQEYLNART